MILMIVVEIAKTLSMDSSRLPLRIKAHQRRDSLPQIAGKTI